jgi:redox-sensing transcriptional repressor
MFNKLFGEGGVKKISNAVKRRLPRYYRRLRALDEAGVESVSSRSLGELLGLTASQIRQDFSHFGGFGHQGYGYYVPKLREALEEILGLKRTWKMVVVGAGNIGRALAGYRFLDNEVFEVAALFDIDQSVIGSIIHGRPVLPMEELVPFINGNGIDIAILTVPQEAAPGVAREIAKSSVRAILNFAPVKLDVGNGPIVESIHIIDSLMSLTYQLTAGNITKSR